jgi:hypothetical protein
MLDASTAAVWTHIVLHHTSSGGLGAQTAWTWGRKQRGPGGRQQPYHGEVVAWGCKQRWPGDASSGGPGMQALVASGSECRDASTTCLGRVVGGIVRILESSPDQPLQTVE